MGWGMTELAKTILKNNSRRSSRPTYFESADLSKKKKRKFFFKTSTPRKLEAVRAKLKQQRIVDLFRILCLVLVLWLSYILLFGN